MMHLYRKAAQNALKESVTNAHLLIASKKAQKRTVVKTEDKVKREIFLGKGLRGDEKTL